MSEGKKYEAKPLEGVIWGKEDKYKSKDGREFTTQKGSMLDERGKKFYITAYVNFTKNGDRYLSLKLKSVEDVERDKAARTGFKNEHAPGEDMNIPF
jgi:hypothetical protein